MLLQHAPVVLGNAAIAGKKEGEGPIGCWFDRIEEDDLLGRESWEKAESQMFGDAVTLAAGKGGVRIDGIDLLLGGDLLNQIIAASFAARDLGLPYLGLYSACATMSQSLLIGSLLIDGGGFGTVMCATSSHFCTAERQLRSPLEHGNVRPPTAQWTVTGAGATLLGKAGDGPRITSVTVGKPVDFGITDANNMGAAMAPAAADTFMAHLYDTGRAVTDYDLIITGDLAAVGASLMLRLCQEAGIGLTPPRYADCGVEIFAANQNALSGGSGCGCSAVVLNGLYMNKLRAGEMRRILFIATGALLSPTSTMQGESIPSVAHAVCLEA